MSLPPFAPFLSISSIVSNLYVKLINLNKFISTSLATILTDLCSIRFPPAWTERIRDLEFYYGQPPSHSTDSSRFLLCLSIYARSQNGCESTITTLWKGARSFGSAPALYSQDHYWQKLSLPCPTSSQESSTALAVFAEVADSYFSCYFAEDCWRSCSSDAVGWTAEDLDDSCWAGSSVAAGSDWKAAHGNYYWLYFLDSDYRD